ncbi:MAG: hypothetical protein PF692_10795 [Kiritimatiellae bacterium]|jgi:hypothetical protein|nr:hypothetical protein [Kiritimatiellia bacterium]
MDCDDRDLVDGNFKHPSFDVPSQGIFDFENGSSNGVEAFRTELEKYFAQVAKEWNVPVNKCVRVTLVDFEGVYEGKLVLVEKPAEIDSGLPLYLNVGKVFFYNSDIESVELI